MDSQRLFRVKCYKLATFNEPVNSSLDTPSEAVKGRLGDILGLSETLLERLGSLMEPPGASWKLLGQPKRFSNDLDVILIPKLRDNLAKNREDL